MKLTKLQKESIVRAISNDIPKPDKAERHAAIQATLVKAMSPECRKLFKKAPSALVQEYVGSIAYDTVYANRYVILGDAPKPALESALKPYREADEKYNDAIHNLKSAIMSCGTLAALKKTFPEFEKYYPTEEQPTKNLPALANVVADLSKLGWPKGVKK